MTNLYFLHGFWHLLVLFNITFCSVWQSHYDMDFDSHNHSKCKDSKEPGSSTPRCILGPQPVLCAPVTKYSCQPQSTADTTISNPTSAPSETWPGSWCCARQGATWDRGSAHPRTRCLIRAIQKSLLSLHNITFTFCSWTSCDPEVSLLGMVLVAILLQTGALVIA